jgi:kynurenine formamidase
MTTYPIDLTMQIEEGMPNSRIHPRSPLVWMCYTHGTTRFLTDETDAEGLAPSFMNEQVLLCGHTGTHVDAPTHIDPKSDMDVSDLSLEKLQGRSIVLDVRNVVDPGMGVSVSELKTAEVDTGTRIESGDIVLLQTGWAERYADDNPEKYLEEHPGLTADAARWLTDTKEIHSLAIDAPNVETHANANTMDVHNRFYRRHREDPKLIIENLMNISNVPDSVCSVVAYPPPVEHATGFPVRVVAHDYQ